MGGGEDRDAPVAAEEQGTAAAAGREEADEPAKDEEDTGAQIAPIVKLEEVTVSTGEENETPLLDMKAKLYRYDREGNQWKERGGGQVKLLEHKESKKIRLLMRQNRTLKICANHYVSASAQLQEHAGSDKSWVWHAADYSDGELKEELFCIRFASIENAQKFKALYEEGQERAAGPLKEAATKAADEAAGLLESLKVKEKGEEEASDAEKTKEVAAEKTQEAAAVE